VTKHELAHELIKADWIDRSEVKSFYDDDDLNIIACYLLYSGREGMIARIESREIQKTEDCDSELEHALFLASERSDLKQWWFALCRRIPHQVWKLHQTADTTGFSAEELRKHQETLRTMERLIESGIADRLWESLRPPDE
jgi:hypothetical protein